MRPLISFGLIVFVLAACQGGDRRQAMEIGYRQYVHLYYVKEGLPHQDQLVLLDNNQFECRRAAIFPNGGEKSMGKGTYEAHPSSVIVKNEDCLLEPKFRQLICITKGAKWHCQSETNGHYLFMMIIG